MFATMPVATAITTTTNCLLTKAITLASDNGVAAVIFQSSAPLVLGQQHRTPSPCHPFAKPRLIHYIASPKKVALTTVWLDMTLAAPPSVCVVDVTIVVNGAAKFVAAIVVVGNILAVSWLCAVSVHIFGHIHSGPPPSSTRPCRHTHKCGAHSSLGISIIFFVAT